MKQSTRVTRYLIFALALSHTIVGLVAFRFGSHFLSNNARTSISPLDQSAEAATPAVSNASDSGTSVSKFSEIQTVATRMPPSASTKGNRSLLERIQSAAARIAAMNQEQVIAALKGLRQMGSGPDRSLQEQLLMARFTELDPELAMAIAGKMSDTDKGQSLVTVWQTWSERDPKAAAAHFRTSLAEFNPMDPSQRESAAAIAAQWAKKDPAQAMAWMRELPEELRGEAYGQALTELARKGPQGAWTALESIPVGYERDEAVERLTDTWAAQFPQQTASWVQGINDPTDQSRAATGLVKQWAQTDASAATDWVASLQPGAARDAAVAALNESPAFLTAPELGVTWSASIQDDQLRSQAMHAAIERWRAIDPDAANAWLQLRSSASP